MYLCQFLTQHYGPVPVCMSCACDCVHVCVSLEKTCKTFLGRPGGAWGRNFLYLANKHLMTLAFVLLGRICPKKKKNFTVHFWAVTIFTPSAIVKVFVRFCVHISVIFISALLFMHPRTPTSPHTQSIYSRFLRFYVWFSIMCSWKVASVLLAGSEFLYRIWPRDCFKSHPKI